MERNTMLDWSLKFHNNNLANWEWESHKTNKNALYLYLQMNNNSGFSQSQRGLNSDGDFTLGQANNEKLNICTHQAYLLLNIKTFSSNSIPSIQCLMYAEARRKEIRVNWVYTHIRNACKHGSHIPHSLCFCNSTTVQISVISALVTFFLVVYSHNY